MTRSTFPSGPLRGCGTRSSIFKPLLPCRAPPPGPEHGVRKLPWWGSGSPSGADAHPSRWGPHGSSNLGEGGGGTWCSERRPHSPLPDSQFGRGVCSVKRLSFPLAELTTGGGRARDPPFLRRLPPWARDSHQRGVPRSSTRLFASGRGGGLEVYASEFSSLRSAISPKEAGCTSDLVA